MCWGIEVVGLAAGRLGAGEDLLGGDQEVDVVKLISLGWVHLPAPGRHHALAIYTVPYSPTSPLLGRLNSAQANANAAFCISLPRKRRDRMIGMSRFTSYGICALCGKRTTKAAMTRHLGS